mmetsp:Transcript_16602/g.49606  ORF Transcript_16602/g.49606 Transcript_16602/m.49606 type:complete len:249 (+) Transcript_16602:947-1693(+)
MFSRPSSYASARAPAVDRWQRERLRWRRPGLALSTPPIACAAASVHSTGLRVGGPASRWLLERSMWMRELIAQRPLHRSSTPRAVSAVPLMLSDKKPSPEWRLLCTIAELSCRAPSSLMPELFDRSSTCRCWLTCSTSASALTPTEHRPMDRRCSARSLLLTLSRSCITSSRPLSPIGMCERSSSVSVVFSATPWSRSTLLGRAFIRNPSSCTLLASMAEGTPSIRTVICSSVGNVALRLSLRSATSW